jgi:hypothetical protein
MIRWNLAAATLAILVTSCAAVEPFVSSPPTAPIKPDPRIFVIAQRDRGRITESLERLDIEVVKEVQPDYLLRAKVGKGKKLANEKDCGSFQSVSYELFEAYVRDSRDQSWDAISRGDRRVLAIKARGWTGNCSPNVWDDMSRVLVDQFSR